MVGGLDLSKGVEGMLMPRRDGSGEWGIIYNDTIRSPGRQNFTLAHELGHYLLHRQTYPNGLECTNRDMADWDDVRNGIEAEANTFASYLLMPLDDFREQIKDRAIDIDVMTDLGRPLCRIAYRRDPEMDDHHRQAGHDRGWKGGLHRLGMVQRAVVKSGVFYPHAQSVTELPAASWPRRTWTGIPVAMVTSTPQVSGWGLSPSMK